MVFRKIDIYKYKYMLRVKKYFEVNIKRLNSI